MPTTHYYHKKIFKYSAPQKLLESWVLELRTLTVSVKIIWLYKGYVLSNT